MENKYTGRSVAFLHHQLALGGSERVSYDAALYFRGLGIRSYFIAADCDEERWLGSERSEFPLIRLPEKGKNKCFISPNVEVLIEAIKEHQIDILFVAVPDKVLPKRIQAETSCKVVFWLHNVPYMEGITKLESYRTQGERKLYNRLMWHLIHQPRLLWGDRLMKRWQDAYEQKLKCYDAVLVLVDGYKRQLVEDLSLSQQLTDKVFVKTNILRIDKPQVRLDEKRKQIIYMGRLSRSDKRIDRLLRVWQKTMKVLTDWELLIYGSGAKEERYLRQLAESLRLERCRFCGYASVPNQVYQTASVLCMTSSYEGLPLAMMEAQTYGVVPMCFDVCAGVREVVGVDEEAGLLIKPFDLDEYAIRLIRLCQDDNLRANLQAKCALKAENYRNLEIDQREWQAILQNMLI